MKENIYNHPLVEQGEITDSEIDHIINSMRPDEAQMLLVKLVYARHMPFCYSKGSKLGVSSWQDFEEVFHQFIHDKLCKATMEHLKKMVLSHHYTGTSFHHYIIDKIHRRKGHHHHIVEEKHAEHIHSPDHDPAESIHQEEYILKCEKIIRSTFQKGDLYVKAFKLHLEGHNDSEINEKLGIHSAHIIKHRILEVLKRAK